jgi:isoleucyl-tRNA synthetase
VDTYRRVRNTLKFLLANIEDFDPATDTVPEEQMLEIDRYALSRTSQIQSQILAHYQVYEFHPVVAKLQIFCSEDLGAFYLDVLKDRLYTMGAQSLARRSAQTALYQITHAMLRWMAPFLSFTAEEAWALMGDSDSIFFETYAKLATPDEALLAKYSRLREIRESVTKDIEALRTQGKVGASLQAAVTVTVPPQDYAMLASLGDELKFALITSSAQWLEGPEIQVKAEVASGYKCERCWHYETDVGQHADHPGLCGRCITNLFGAGESRLYV